MKKLSALFIFIALASNLSSLPMDQEPLQIPCSEKSLQQVVAQRIQQGATKSDYNPKDNLVYTCSQQAYDNIKNEIIQNQNDLLVYDHEGQHTFNLKFYNKQEKRFIRLCFLTQNEGDNFISECVPEDFNVAADCALFILPQNIIYYATAKKIIKNIITGKNTLIIVKPEDLKVDLNFVSKYHKSNPTPAQHNPSPSYFSNIKVNINMTKCITVFCGCCCACLLAATPFIFIYKVVDRTVK